jgi:CheY-like chemotaxis protein
MGGRQVLVVDDDEDVLRALRVALEREGHRVRVARNAVQALALADARAPDLVLLDLVMPVAGGWDLVRRLRSDPRRPRPSLILVSAHPGLADEAARLGVDTWLRKPFRIDELLEAIRGPG